MARQKPALETVFKGRPFRVFAIFAIGIILPSGFLSYLGFRSFQYERLLLTKQTEERYAALGDTLQRKADEYLHTLVSSLQHIVSSGPFQQRDFPAMITSLLSVHTLGPSSLHSVFLFDENEQMIIPGQAGRSTLAAKEVRPDLEWGALAPEMKRLEDLEFADKNVADAVKGYLLLRVRVTKPLHQAALLKNIASGYRKLGSDRSAETYYQELIRRFEHLPDPSGYPSGVVGRQLLAKLYDNTGQKERACNVRLDLMEGILLNRWDLTPSQRPWLFRQCEEALKPLLATSLVLAEETRQRHDRIKKLQVAWEAWQGAARRFLVGAWPAILKRIHSQGGVEHGGVLRLPDSTLPEWILLAPVRPSPTRRAQGWAIALLDPTPIQKDLGRMTDDLASSNGLKVLWEFQKPLSSSERPSWKPTLQRALTAIDPPLTFRIFEPVSQAGEGFFQRRVRIYGGMLGLSLIVILAGLVVMVQAIRREMEVTSLKADFVANVSHELRTPLTVISYIGERLSRGRYRSTEEAQKFYTMLGQETERLRELIEDILDFSKMLGGRRVYRKDPLDLAAVTEEAYTRFQGKAAAKGFEVVFQAPEVSVPIQGDRKAIIQAILNFLDNALKYSGDSRKIHLGLSIRDDHAVVLVKDFGIGVAPADKEKIFEKFYRVEHALVRDSEGGVGLGLAMVKHIMEGHGGRITVESELGKGSDFSLWFPLCHDGGNDDANSRS